MSSTLCLALLQLAVARSSGSGFQVEQPGYLEAAVGGSVTLPCSFTHPGTSMPRGIDVSWRVGNYKGTYIFSSLLNHTAGEYQGRVEFLGSPLRDKTGSIRIHPLKEVDSNTYFCSVTMFGEESKTWQSNSGTVLSVKARTSGNGFWVEQPGYLEAAVGGSVTLPCSFTHPGTSTPRDIDVRWRVGNYKGTYIFSSLQNDVLGEYRGRVEFLGSPLRDKTGSIRIHPLKEVDSNTYFCGVTMFGEVNETWQSNSGTVLSVKDGPLTPRVTAAMSGTPGLSHVSILMVRSALALGLLAVVWAMGIYLMKRNRGAGAHTRGVKEERKGETRL